MNAVILHTEVQNFINQHLNSEISKLIFKGSPFKDITIQELAEQIQAKKRCENKLLTWFSTENIYYPNKLNIEQTSSEITAEYKSTLISADSLIDLTGGFGIDAYYFSKRIKQVLHCEINPELSKIVQHNYEQLGVKNIRTFAEDGIEYLKSKKEHFDCIYIDPSRRNDSKGKVFLLEDCLPNVPKYLDLLFEYADTILIKVSPMLDITSAINELKFVKEVHVVAVTNEVKELLFVLEKSYKGAIKLKTINIATTKKQTFESIYKEASTVGFSSPKNYLYEPNTAILKAGLFNELTELGVHKLQQNSHLYTSDALIDFPGRQFKIQHCVAYDKKQLNRLIPSKKANITTRNFPETVVQIRKKTGFKDGGSHYLFFTKDINNKHIVLVCEKV